MYAKISLRYFFRYSQNKGGVKSINQTTDWMTIIVLVSSFLEVCCYLFIVSLSGLLLRPRVSA